MASRRTRAKTPEERRRHQVVIRLNDAELELVDRACDRSGMARAQWVMTAVDAELGRGPGPGEITDRGQDLKDLFAARTALDRIGNNLNQAVMVLHSSGEVETRQLRAILDRVERAVGQIDTAAGEIGSKRRRRGRRR